MAVAPWVLCVMVALLLVVEVVGLLVRLTDRWYRGINNLMRTDPDRAEMELAWRPWYVRAFDWADRLIS